MVFFNSELSQEDTQMLYGSGKIWPPMMVGGSLMVLSLLSMTNAYAADECKGNNSNDIMVKVGTLCVDKYEASVWSNPDGTGTQYGTAKDDYPANFPDTGNWAAKLYAVSKQGVAPSRYITWFQAQQACAISGKRLLTNAEWQMAAAGTPDTGKDDGKTDCAVSNAIAPTGSRSSCSSKWEVNDMVGNVWEWVADWGHSGNDHWAPTGHATTDTTNQMYGNDVTAEIQAAHIQGQGKNLPSAWVRGGGYRNLGGAGIFAIDMSRAPSDSGQNVGNIGFRCAR